MVDPRTEVASAAADAMLAGCQTIGNRDLEPHISALVSCIARPTEVPDVIAKLSATTFVQVGHLHTLWVGQGAGRVAGAMGRPSGCRVFVVAGAVGMEVVGRGREVEPQLLLTCAASAAAPPQTVEDGMLAVMVPLMVRALRERSTTVKRRATIIIENMCKLVSIPGDMCWEGGC